MRAVVLDNYGSTASLAVREVETPVPRRGEVLIKIAAGSINPADIAFVEGTYGFRKPLPTVPGFEGTGVVVAANAGLYGRWLVGKRVACAAPNDGWGTWAEYMTCPAGTVIPLAKNTSTEFGATLLVNPLTALVLLDKLKRGGHRAFIQTAAASSLGRMMAQLATSEGIPAIHVVRRAETAAELRAAGLTHVLCSADADYTDNLARLSAELGATIAFDPVAGSQTKQLAASMPNDSTIVIFGGLAGDEDTKADTRDVIFKGTRIEGFWLVRHLPTVPRLRLIRMSMQIQRNAAIFGSRVLAKLPLEDIAEGVALQARASEGKVLLAP